MLSLAKLTFGQQSFFQPPRTLWCHLHLCYNRVFIMRFCWVTVSLRWYPRTLFIGSSAGRSRSVNLLIFTPEIRPLSKLIRMEEGTIFTFTCSISASFPLCMPEAGNRHVLLPADCGKLAQEFWGMERCSAKARKWGAALTCTLQPVFYSPFPGEI